MTLEIAGTIRPSLLFLSEHVGTLNPTEIGHLGAVARRLLTFALSIAPDDRGLLVVAIAAVNKTTIAEPAASISLLRECITPEHLQSIGHRTLRFLADGVTTLALLDPAYVRDLYLAALRHQDTSQEATSMNDSQIFGMTSHRQQDYKGGLYALGRHYPEFLRRAPETAVVTLLGVLDLFAQEHHHTSTHSLPVVLGEVQATLVPDQSYSWDGMLIYEHDLPITMVSALQKRLQTLADEDNGQAIQYLFNHLATAPVPGIVWRRLLTAGTLQPDTLGRHLRSLAWDPTILTSKDTTRIAGTFLHTIHPILDTVDRERIEQAILALPTGAPYETHNRDRLLGCLDAAYIVTNAARAVIVTLTATGGAPPNVGEDEGAWGFLPAAPILTDGMHALITPIKAFAQQTGPPEAAAIEAVFPLLQALHEAITTPTEPLTIKFATEAASELMEAANKIAHSDTLTNQQCAQLLPIILFGVTDPSPEPSKDDDQETPVSGWSPALRISAAEAITLLARFSAACTSEVQAAIRRLSTDPVCAVRSQIASRTRYLYQTAPELFWELLEHIAAEEPNPTILLQAAQTLYHVPVAHAARAATLASQIFNRTPSTAEPSKVRDACIHVFCEFDLYASDEISRHTLEGLVKDPTMYANDVQRIILDLSVKITVSEVAVRTRAFTLLQHSLTTIKAAMQDIILANKGTTPWPSEVQAQYGGLLRCADEIAQRLHFAAEAFKDESQEPTFLPAAVFYEHSKPILTDLADIGHPHIAHNVLEALVHFIRTDPAGVLILAGKVVGSGSKYGYQYEPMAETLITDMVGQYLAEYRHFLRESSDCHAALMDILDTFVRVGWPRAHQLTYRLSEIYR